MSAIKLDAPPGLISGSPIFLFFQACIWLFHTFFRCLNLNCISLVHKLLLNSCSAILRVLSNSNATWASCSTSVLVQNVLSQVQPLCTSATCAGWLVPAACTVLSHSTDSQHTNSKIANPKHFRLQAVSHNVPSLLLSASTAGIHQCGQACQEKLLASTSCSTWLHPQNGFGPNKFLQMAPLLQCSPCLGWNDKAFSRFPSLQNCSQPMHSAEPSSPSTHDQVQFLCCISLRRLHEMLEAVPESSNLHVLHAPKLPFEPFVVAVAIKFVD